MIQAGFFAEEIYVVLVISFMKSSNEVRIEFFAKNKTLAMTIKMHHARFP